MARRGGSLRVEVVTVFAPRPEHPKWRDYLTGLGLQRDTATRWKCRHVVVSDADIEGFQILRAELPQSLMRAQLVGQLAYLEQWDDSHHVLLVDADCLLPRDPMGAFGDFDIGLTWRPVPPLNNGAMYLTAGSKARTLPFFRHALSLCKDHWGGDQEAITQAASPLPEQVGGTFGRLGARVKFLSMRSHNCVPERKGVTHDPQPYVLHFKGEHRKEWMCEYAERFIFGSEVLDRETRFKGESRA